MEISKVKVRLVGQGKLKALATVTIEEKLVIHDIKVLDFDNGLFIAMPSIKIRIGEFKDIVHPITVDFREYMSKQIILEYNKKIEAKKT